MKIIEGIEKLAKEYDQLEEVTLDEFIMYLKRLSELGYGNKRIVAYPTGGTPFPWYQQDEDLLEL